MPSQLVELFVEDGVEYENVIDDPFGTDGVDVVSVLVVWLCVHFGTRLLACWYHDRYVNEPSATPRSDSGPSRRSAQERPLAAGPAA